jgi:hypothetical protein
MRRTSPDSVIFSTLRNRVEKSALGIFFANQRDSSGEFFAKDSL